ncbi:GDP-L-fucose synthase [Geothermobacter ehrlichii]|uniref:GDP-L-fucose synthase n=2 Tax=Geothermobacter ehrlichii TaxID=213224 RepID=A0A5D3WLJ1_9BACT|nr:GDP-L-fucose synthase [Geothermobacter ehrlichii]TYO98373.1 GDP-L-fucose synthase [Geothermobacter ehrlichii]
MMNKNSRIFVAGARGLVGSAMVRRLRAEGYDNLLTPERDQLDLTNQAAVRDFFHREKPEYVILAAARVGGIHANNTYPAEFIYQNLAIQNNVIHSAWECGVERLLFLGSSCIYPRLAPQPMREEHLLTGSLEPTNEPYAIAKIAGLKMCEAYNRQYGTRFVAVMPTNLYGPGDNFHPENSHVLPALIRRFHEAKLAGASEVVVWGSGKPMREFLFVDDMADGSLFVLNLPDEVLAENLLSYPRPCFVNLGTGEDVSIRQLAETVREVVGFAGKLVFDTSKPDGTPRKLLEVSRLRELGWRARTPLREGIEQTYRWFLDNAERVRG